MMCRLVGLLALLYAGAGYATEAPLSANALAETMRQAKYSDGFEARLNVLVTKADGAHPAPLKLAVIGQLAAERQRLLIRGIAPATVRNHAIAAERSGNGRIRAVESRAANEYAAFDPQSRMFDTGLVVWDMFSPWWGWPRQSLEGIERIKGRECEKIRSVTDDKNSLVREVESCVDRQAKLSLITRLFDSRHTLLRTLSVEQVLRKGAVLTAKGLAVAEAGKARTDIEVYAGDEEYQVSAETFAALNHPTQDK
jgi:hypothetical protein